MGFMDKFGTGQGWLAKNLGKQARIDRKATRRDNSRPGSGKYNRLSNQINRLSGSDVRYDPTGTMTDFTRSYSDAEFDGPPRGIGEYGQFNTSKFDVSNPADVSAFQAQAIREGLLPETFVNAQGETVSSADGMFGPDTQKAWEEYVSGQRNRKGLLDYTYEDPNSNQNITNNANPFSTTINAFTDTVQENNLNPDANIDYTGGTAFNTYENDPNTIEGLDEYNNMGVGEKIVNAIPSAEGLGNFWGNVWTHGFDGKPGWFNK